ncbi:MAG: type II toxin-antitoxin system VapC family toxin [Pseudomonadota bacterium]
MRICIDTTILIDILKDEYRSFQEMLYVALARKESLVIPTVVFAELMPQFEGDTEQINLFLKEHLIRIDDLDLNAVIAAGSRWLQYLKRKSRVKCPKCGYDLIGREHFLSDFYIGGFALTHCDAILSRDRGIYRKYFPELKGYGDCLS